MNYEKLKELLPEGFSNGKNVVMVGKALRDASLLREKARFVIVLDKDASGNIYCRELIDNTKPGYIVSVIAILAPVQLFGGRFTLDQGLVLEIGLSRGRPYTQAEIKSDESDRGRSAIKGRRKLCDISFPEMEVAWPKIIDFLCKATTKLQNGRTYQNNYVLPGRDYVFEAGMRITVSKKDKILYWKIVIEDERSRTRSYLADRAEWIAKSLRPYLGSKVSGNRFKNLKGVSAVAGALIHMRRYTFAPNHLMRKLISLLPKDVRGIFEEVVDAYNLSNLLNMLKRDPVFPHEYILAQGLPRLKESYLSIKRKQGKSMKKRESGRKRRQIGSNGFNNGNAHAQGCVVAEFYFKEKSAG